MEPSTLNQMDIASLDKLDEQNRIADLGSYMDDMSDVANNTDLQLEDTENVPDEEPSIDEKNREEGRAEPFVAKKSYNLRNPHPTEEEKTLSLLYRYNYLNTTTTTVFFKLII